MVIFALIWDFIEHFLNLVGDFALFIGLVFRVLIFLASLGGITVIIGGWAILRGHETLGKVLIIIGCGTGFITLLVQFLIAYGTRTWDVFNGTMMTFTGIGTLMALAARKLA